MEYRIVKPISIYNLIVAGASRMLVRNFELKFALKVDEVLIPSDDTEWLLRWVMDTGYLWWFMEKGFIEEGAQQMSHKVGDRFDIVFAGPLAEAQNIGAVNGILDEVMLICWKKEVRIVSLRTGIVGEYGHRFVGMDDNITDEWLEKVVKLHYGERAYSGKVE